MTEKDAFISFYTFLSNECVTNAMVEASVPLKKDWSAPLEHYRVFFDDGSLLCYIHIINV